MQFVHEYTKISLLNNFQKTSDALASKAKSFKSIDRENELNNIQF